MFIYFIVAIILIVLFLVFLGMSLGRKFLVKTVFDIISVEKNGMTKTEIIKYLKSKDKVSSRKEIEELVDEILIKLVDRKKNILMIPLIHF